MLPQPAPSRKVLSLHCFKVLHRILATSFSIIHPSPLPSGIFLLYKCLSCYSLRQLNPKFAIWGNLLFLMLSQIQILYFEIDSSQDFCFLVGHLAVCPFQVFSGSVFQLPTSNSQRVLQITPATASIHSPHPLTVLNALVIPLIEGTKIELVGTNRLSFQLQHKCLTVPKT